MSNYEDLRGARANTEIILDDLGLPSVMVKIPLVYLDDFGIGSTHTPHPAFVVNGKVVPYIYVSKYINIIKNNRAYSLPNQDPANRVTFDRAVEVCYKKGAGWHLMTAAEWGVLQNLTSALSVKPRGNTDNGRSSDRSWERGVLSPGNTTNVYRTLTGTGGTGWSAEFYGEGVFDFVGNVGKWIVARLVDGEIQIVPNNNAAVHNTDLSANSNAWRAILPDGSYAEPGTAGTMKLDYVSNPSTNGDFQINTSLQYKQTDESTFGVMTLEKLIVKSGVTAPDLLKAMGILWHGYTTGAGAIYMKNIGERLFIRGGNYSERDNAGFGCGDFLNKRSFSYANVGFFSAYVNPEMYA